MARRRRRYGSTVGINLGDLPGLGRSINSTDALIGAGVGVVAAALVKGIANMVAPGPMAQVRGASGAFFPVLASAAAAAGVYFGSKMLLKSSPEKAMSYAVGAALPGVASTVTQLAQQYVAPATGGALDFSGTVGVNLGRYGGQQMGMLVNDGSDQGAGYGGLLVADHSDNLAELAAISMGPDSDGIAELMTM